LILLLGLLPAPHLRTMWKEFALPPLSQLHGVDWRIGTYIIHDVGAEKMPKAPRTKFCRHVSKV